jgi:hypothetical protein
MAKLVGVYAVPHTPRGASRKDIDSQSRMNPATPTPGIMPGGGPPRSAFELRPTGRGREPARRSGQGEGGSAEPTPQSSRAAFPRRRFSLWLR